MLSGGWDWQEIYQVKPYKTKQLVRQHTLLTVTLCIKSVVFMWAIQLVGSQCSPNVFEYSYVSRHVSLLSKPCSKSQDNDETKHEVVVF
jgi:hypothetical protein